MQSDWIVFSYLFCKPAVEISDCIIESIEANYECMLILVSAVSLFLIRIKCGLYSTDYQGLNNYQYISQSCYWLINIRLTIARVCPSYLHKQYR